MPVTCRTLPAPRRAFRSLLVLAGAALASVPVAAHPQAAARTQDVRAPGAMTPVMHRTVKVRGLDIFYREAGPKGAPVVLLLHGFPTSSHMFRNLIPALADRYHVVAPDFPGYGQSSMPSRDQFQYTFANLADVTEQFTQALGLDRYTLYVMDYGAPVGYRLALAHPERVQALIVQNGNAYDEGLREFWDQFRTYWASNSPEHRNAMRALLKPEITRWQYLNGVRDSARVSPDNWIVDQHFLDRPGNDEVQLDLFYDYRTNVPLYPQFQAFFRKYQPPTLIVWGKDDHIFPWQGAVPYKRDLKTVETHLLDTGHFALEERGDEIAGYIRGFLRKHVDGRSGRVVTARGAAGGR